MTAETDLLPLPSGNVAHLIAAQAAEIEALRAEVEALRAELDNKRADGVHSCGDHCKREACVLRRRAERLAEALALLPGEIDMVEANPDEGPRTFCCGRGVKYRGLHDLHITHEKDCWYVRMCALRDHAKENDDD